MQARIKQVSSVTTLGAFIATHSQAVVGSKGRAIQSYIALGVGGVGLVMALIGWLTNRPEFLTVCGGGLALVGLGLGGMGLADANSTADASVGLYADGIAYADKKGSKMWRWTDIERIYSLLVQHRQTRIVRKSYRLDNANGEVMHLTDFIAGIDDVMTVVRQKVYPPLIHKLMAEYEAGKPLVFGPIAIDRANGIAVKKTKIAWDECGGMQLGAGYVFVTKHGGGPFNDASVLAGDVPNVEILLSIVNHRVNPPNGT